MSITTKFIKVVECDFTQSDYGFTWLGSNGETPSYGRNSGGLYMYYNDSGNNNKIGAWKIPSSIYSQGTIKKIELTLYSTASQNGGGIGDTASDYDHSAIRTWMNTLQYHVDSGYSRTDSPVNNPANTEYKVTIDIENSSRSMSNGYSGTLSSAMSSKIRTNFSSGNCSVILMRTKNTGTAYMRKAKFYLKN